jgi:GTP-binding protein
MTPEDIKAQTAKLKKAAKKTPLVISAQSGQGLEDALRALTKYIDKARIVEPEDATPSEKAWQP